MSMRRCSTRTRSLIRFDVDVFELWVKERKRTELPERVGYTHIQKTHHATFNDYIAYQVNFP